MFNIDFKSLRELIKAFPDEQTCVNHLEQLRWNGNVVSPFDASSKVYKCAGNKYRCKNTSKYFNVKTYTLFDNTKVELQTWFIAIYLITGHKKGISSLQLAKDLNVTQKTAWFMLQRIRNCFGITAKGDNNNEKMGGEGVIVEVDETYVGGKVKNMSNKRRKAIKKNGTGEKIGVLGYMERGGALRLKVMQKGIPIKDSLADNVTSDSAIMTDSAWMYRTVGKQFAFHGVVDHTNDEYVKDGFIHTNSIEGAFSLFDRMVMGIYHYISPKHLEKYLDELVFRYNSRKISECSRFNLLISQCTNRLTYKNLIK